MAQSGTPLRKLAPSVEPTSTTPVLRFAEDIKFRRKISWLNVLSSPKMAGRNQSGGPLCINAGPHQRQVDILPYSSTYFARWRPRRFLGALHHLGDLASR